MPIDALNVLCAQVTRDLFAIAKFLLSSLFECIRLKSLLDVLLLMVMIWLPFLSASLYVIEIGCVVTSLVVGWLSRTCMHCGQTVHPRPIVTMEH